VTITALCCQFKCTLKKIQLYLSLAAMNRFLFF
jgi:hypothetical protein